MSIWDRRELVRVAENGVATLREAFVRAPTPLEAQAAEALRQELRRLNDVEGALPFWRDTCEALARHAEEEDPRFFMRWPPIKSTMVNGTTAFSVDAYRRLRRTGDWKAVWKAGITHQPYGHGPPFLPYPRTNANTVMHAAHLLHFQSTTGRNWLAHDTIAEFGGGYGSMCRLAADLGFAGDYAIFDLPPIHALQRYYLTLHETIPRRSVLLTPSLSDVARAMGPRSALMSTWALSEMPMPLREEIAALLHDTRVCSALFAYQRSFEGIDNVAWFADLAARTADQWDWRLTRIDVNSDYLVGTRRP